MAVRWIASMPSYSQPLFFTISKNIFYSMKNLTILGSTGSIGTNTLNIVAMHSDRFAVKALAAATNVALLAEQIQQFRPEVAVVIDEVRAQHLKEMLPSDAEVEILWGDSGYHQAAVHPEVTLVVTAFVGASGLLPTLAAIDAGKDIALANKETLVIAGALVMREATRRGVKILPVDSEHSAIFQCLQGQHRQDVSRILLTASGGPFRETPANQMATITPDQALNHPTWSMGNKITIDSSTLMNKGLEVIEATWLFDVPPDMIEVVVHPQSIVHSMVSFRDGAVIAQLGEPDMKAAIAYALTYPERFDIQQTAPDFPALGTLTFHSPDFSKFPCLRLAFEACKVGGTLPAAMNAANEVAVEAFLGERLSYPGIAQSIEKVMARHSVVLDPSLEDIMAADNWARKVAAELIMS
jgi:1-deoxy-D-xylulose-5-phosphate reductoisomerase